MRTYLAMALAASSVFALACDDESSDTIEMSGGQAPAGTGGDAQAGAGAAGLDIAASTGGIDAPAMPAEMDIIETALGAGDFKQLAGALTTAGLVDTLKGTGPFTVFAPNDAAFDAFEKANPGVFAKLTKEELTGILTYHVISGAAMMSKDLKSGGVAQTVAGSPVLFDLSKGAMVNDAKVTTADIVAKNGVIHVIDSVMLPPTDDIVATAIAAGSFKSLAGALTSAGLVETLQGEGPFTVFAPTDDAFAKLAEVPTGDALKNVLLYHVVDGVVGAGDLVAGAVPSLLKNKALTVVLEDGVKINQSTVTTANILCKNGVIHIVDSVLVPE